jgi:hypothetical protein
MRPLARDPRPVRLEAYRALKHGSVPGALPAGVAERRGGRKDLGGGVVCSGDCGLAAAGALHDRPGRRPEL